MPPEELVRHRAFRHRRSVNALSMQCVGPDVTANPLSPQRDGDGVTVERFLHGYRISLPGWHAIAWDARGQNAGDVREHVAVVNRDGPTPLDESLELSELHG